MHRWRRLTAVLLLASGASIAVPGSFGPLSFEPVYDAGSRDATGRFLGGTETMSLVAHRGTLFAGLGFWMDVPYLADKPTGPWTGAQVVVKETADAPWRVDVSFGPSYLRTESLAVRTLTTDGLANRLVPPVPLLVAGPSDGNPLARSGRRPGPATTRPGPGPPPASRPSPRRPASARSALPSTR